MTTAWLLPLLVVNLVFTEAGQREEFWCYKCENERTDMNCDILQKCEEYDSYCVTSVIHGESGERWFSKGCAPHCPKHQVGVANPRSILTECCRERFCNKSGSTSVKISHMAVCMWVLASFLYIFQSGL